MNRYFDMPWVGYDQTGQYREGPARHRPSAHLQVLRRLHQELARRRDHVSPNILLYSGTPITTEVPVVSSTPMFPYGRGDLGRTPFFQNWDMNLVHELIPFKSREAVRVRFEFTVFNLFNNSTITDRSKGILHPSDGQLYFVDANGDPDYASIFKGFDTRALMTAQGDRMDPQYGMAMRSRLRARCASRCRSSSRNGRSNL